MVHTYVKMSNLETLCLLTSVFKNTCGREEKKCQTHFFNFHTLEIIVKTQLKLVTYGIFSIVLLQNI